jgi:hypothetical protein
MIEMASPLRRHVAELWFNACDAYGRAAAARGSLATVLRLNRLLDRGISFSVVGYTDVLVETLLNKRGIVLDASEPGENIVVARLSQLEEELAALRDKRA